MNRDRVVLLNTSILTAFGSFEFKAVSKADARTIARRCVQSGGLIDSAIRHAATAQIVCEDLGIEIQSQIPEFFQSVGDVALVFRLRSRPQFGRELTREDIFLIGYEYGLLTRNA